MRDTGNLQRRDRLEGLRSSPSAGKADSESYRVVGAVASSREIPGSLSL